MAEPVLIGGHNNEVGRMEVWRTERGIVKVAFDEHNKAALQNERRMLEHVADLAIAPDLPGGESPHLALNGRAVYRLWQQDLGDCAPVTNGEMLRHEAIRLLWALRQMHARHGDLTGPRDDGVSNLIWNGKYLRAVDWAGSHLFDEAPPEGGSP